MNNREKIERIIKKNPQGLTIVELAGKSKLTRQTVATILAKLEGEKSVIIRKIGRAKLHFWKKEAKK